MLATAPLTTDAENVFQNANVLLSPKSLKFSIQSKYTVPIL